MERRQAIVVATVVAAAFAGGAAAVVANNDLVGSRGDNVGKLEPVATVAGTSVAPIVTKYFDPATGRLTDAPPTTVGATGGAGSSSTPEATVRSGPGSVGVHHSDDHTTDHHGEDHHGDHGGEDDD
jgi:hypothetical protein